MEQTKFKITKLACYSAYFTMSSVFCLPPLLFVIFHERYGVSWTLLGTLVLVNFCTQLAVDLLFTVFSKGHNIKKIVKTMPLITALGLGIYAVVPAIFPDAAYIGLLMGTVVFSVAAGLSEVLLSPIIAAIPSKDPQRDMSLLHSLYAFGVFTTVLVGTGFLKLFGPESWTYLTLLFAALPLIPAVLFSRSPMPNMDTAEASAQENQGRKRLVGIALCVGCIFLGSCAENTMSNWISSYMEAQLHLDKAVGDILGVAMFAILLGLGRIAYAKWGKNVGRILLSGMAGAAVCYVVAGLSSAVVPALIACVLTGVFTSMLWPGALLFMEENIPGAGVAAFALMAAGGDLGASVAPQLMGMVADASGLQAGMLVCSVFPILGVVLVSVTISYFKAAPSKKK